METEKQEELAEIVPVDNSWPAPSPAPKKRARQRRDFDAKSSFIALALKNNATIDVIERLVGLQERAQAKAAETDFFDALNRVQKEIDIVRPDLRNPSTNSQYASYAALDREVRPLYTGEGFSISYNEEDSSKPEHVRVIAILARGGHKERYRKDIAVNTKGLRGNEAMTITWAEGSANTYGKRYLLGNIFNIPVGELELDDDGNAAGGRPNGNGNGNGKNGQDLTPILTESEKQALEAKARACVTEKGLTDLWETMNEHQREVVRPVFKERWLKLREADASKRD